LKEQCPESGTLTAEIFYWRDITRVLDAVIRELKQPFVEMTVQVLVLVEQPSTIKKVTSFQTLKDRVVKGGKEARWNNKQVKTLLPLVSAVQDCEQIQGLSTKIDDLLLALKKVFENSNFYKELRI